MASPGAHDDVPEGCPARYLATVGIPANDSTAKRKPEQIRQSGSTGQPRIQTRIFILTFHQLSFASMHDIELHCAAANSSFLENSQLGTNNVTCPVAQAGAGRDGFAARIRQRALQGVAASR